MTGCPVFPATIVPSAFGYVVSAVGVPLASTPNTQQTVSFTKIFARPEPSWRTQPSSQCFSRSSGPGLVGEIKYWLAIDVSQYFPTGPGPFDGSFVHTTDHILRQSSKSVRTSVILQAVRMRISCQRRRQYMRKTIMAK